MFYPDKKAHMSPSALDSWFNQRSNFIKSYFEGIRTPDTPAMLAGKKVHALIEAGIFKAKKVYELNEKPITIILDKGKTLYGIPDSRQKCKGKMTTVCFVDYKTGKENAWKEKLPSDIKMKATAWLIWVEAEKPSMIRACIEYIPTEWDSVAKEVVPIEGAESEIIEIMYSGAELAEFTQVILKAMDEVNEEYEKWLTSTGNFVSEEDMQKYAELKAKKDELEVEMKEIGGRIMSQLEFGGKSTLKTPLGTFYVTERKAYEYPKTLAVKWGSATYTLEEAEEISMAAKAAQKNFEIQNDPKLITKSMGFRAPKEN